ncbi:hypothetical protein FHR37_004570 [Actinopolymorpha cephalotaxi]|uniref:Uncharacterized protein n=1 Tax=Actinopolymorpha cephalotaxi TaxID=504797 RepID=A0ABX2S7U1_9ACTN|nr:hypothetical protein [Actinopolymorpha cephalotaxi]
MMIIVRFGGLDRRRSGSWVGLAWIRLLGAVVVAPVQGCFSLIQCCFSLVSGGLSAVGDTFSFVGDCFAVVGHPLTLLRGEFPCPEFDRKCVSDPDPLLRRLGAKCPGRFAFASRDGTIFPQPPPQCRGTITPQVGGMPLLDAPVELLRRPIAKLGSELAQPGLPLPQLTNSFVVLRTAIGGQVRAHILESRHLAGRRSRGHPLQTKQLLVRSGPNPPDVSVRPTAGRATLDVCPQPTTVGSTNRSKSHEGNGSR